MYSNYPIYRIKIPPGCSYIAPTQNIVHDGETNDNGYEDANFISGVFCD